MRSTNELKRSLEFARAPQRLHLSASFCVMRAISTSATSLSADAVRKYCMAARAIEKNHTPDEPRTARCTEPLWNILPTEPFCES